MVCALRLEQVWKQQGVSAQSFTCFGVEVRVLPPVGEAVPTFIRPRMGEAASVVSPIMGCCPVAEPLPLESH